MKLDFYIEQTASGSGSVTLALKKPILTWLYRLIRFGETSFYLEDKYGKIIIWNKIGKVEEILARRLKAFESCTYDFKPQPNDWYNERWEQYGVSFAEMYNNPSKVYPKFYSYQFTLEKWYEKRKYQAFWVCPKTRKAYIK